MNKKETNKKYTINYNNRISCDYVRIINKNDFEDNIADVISKENALGLANKLSTDLVEVSVNKKDMVSICKLIDIDKYIYQLKKQEKQAKAQQVKNEIKEIRFSPSIGDNDYQTKLKQSFKFLEKGDSLKAFVQFKGRELYVMKDQGEAVLLKFANDLNNIGKVIQMPTLAGRRMYLQIVPK